MSIIIKGMDMPKDCGSCGVRQEAKCGTDYKWLVEHPDYYGTKRPDCPLIEIPTPHGRLIEEHYPGELKAKHAEGIFIIFRSADEDTDRFILEEEEIS